MVQFIIGMIIGATIGVVLMCILIAGKELASQIDILPIIYNQSCAIQKAMRL